ncbi:hypothetical protein, partial [Vibrio bathopelagicus]
MKTDSVLIVCFDIDDFKEIGKMDLSMYRMVIIASDDFRVHEKCKKDHRIKGVTFLQKNIEYTKVSDDVIKIIEKINYFYQNVGNTLKLFKKDFMKLPTFVEGGEYTQKIQDLLLYIESLNAIFNRFNINNIIILSDSNKFVSKIINQYAIDNRIKISLTKKSNSKFSKYDIKYKV